MKLKNEVNNGIITPQPSGTVAGPEAYPLHLLADPRSRHLGVTHFSWIFTLFH